MNTVVITPENSTFHLTQRGTQLIAADLLARLVEAESVLVSAFGEPKGRLHSLENGRATDAIQATRIAIANATGMGIRAQSFAERERDLLAANNAREARARAAEKCLAVTPEFLDEMAATLDGWVAETHEGRWSTVHVEAMTKQADACRRHAAAIRAAKG